MQHGLCVSHRRREHVSWETPASLYWQASCATDTAASAQCKEWPADRGKHAVAQGMSGRPKTWARPWRLLMVGRLMQAGRQASQKACLDRGDPMLLACRLSLLLRTGPGVAAVAPPGMLPLVCSPMQPFAQLPVHQREAILQWWSGSPIPLMKKVCHSFPRPRMPSYVCRAPCTHLRPGPVCRKQLVIESGRTPVGSETLLWGRVSPAVLPPQAGDVQLVGRREAVRALPITGLLVLRSPCSGVSAVGGPARALG